MQSWSKSSHYERPGAGLVWSAIVNGGFLMPIMVAMMRMSQSTRVMGDLRLRQRHRVFGSDAVLVFWTL